MIFKIRIAEKNIEIDSIYERVYYLCRDYIVDDTEVDFSIKINQDDILFERNISDNKGYYSDDYLETLAVYRKISVRFLDYNTFLMHGSVVAVDQKAYMFLAPSGTGKTTHMRLWLSNIEGCTIVNGDKPLIMIKDGMPYACGTPWCGKEGYNKNTQVPVNAIYLLERADENSVKEISFIEAFPTLLQQTYKPKDSACMVKTLNLIKAMKSGVKCYKLKCNREPDAAVVAYQKAGL